MCVGVCFYYKINLVESRDGIFLGFEPYEKATHLTGGQKLFMEQSQNGECVKIACICIEGGRERRDAKIKV